MKVWAAKCWGKVSGWGQEKEENDNKEKKKKRATETETNREIKKTKRERSETSKKYEIRTVMKKYWKREGEREKEG